MLTNLEPMRLGYPQAPWWTEDYRRFMSPPIVPPRTGFQPLQAAPQMLPPTWIGAPTMAPMQATPADVEAQMLGGFLREQAGDVIRKIFNQLDAHAEQSAQYADCIALLGQAVQQFTAGEYGNAFSLAYEAWKSGVAGGLPLQSEIPAAQPHQQAAR
jgi:hypothetical protein